MNIKNIGIYAHVDAGKTTITEHLLYRAGAIRHIGRVDNGDTQTDTMELERKRGISIQSAPISFMLEHTKVNLIDTPGHGDFIAEVERSMNVLDGAILVISAKEGVQSHTNLLFEALSSRSIPTIIFVNKIDRLGVNMDELLEDIQKNLTPKGLPLSEVYKPGERSCKVTDIFSINKEKTLEYLADYDEELLESYINNLPVELEVMKKKILSLANEGCIYPIVLGSALHGIGMEGLMEAIACLLPSYATCNEQVVQPTGTVFKVKRNAKKQKQVYIRLYQGEVHTRDYLREDKITKIEGLCSGKEIAVDKLASGDIGILYGMEHLQVGDCFGVDKKNQVIQLGTPTLKVQIKTVEHSKRKELLDALVLMSEEDPYLQYELSDTEQDIFINIFGEIQLEIIKDRLDQEYHISVTFEEPMTIFKETPVGAGEAVMYLYNKDHPFIATVGLRVEPIERGKGLVYRSEVTTGFLPRSFQNGIEDGIRDAYGQGLKGWELTDICITLIKGEFRSVDSTPSDFRDVTPMVLLEAVSQAKTKLLWPFLEFKLKIPQAMVGKAMSDLICKKAVFQKPELMGEFYSIQGTIPAALCRKYELEVISYTEGKGIWMTSFYQYDDAPRDMEAQRKKTKVDPLNKGQYILCKRGGVKNKTT